MSETAIPVTGHEGLCELCRGRGNFAAMNRRRLEWWVCPCCCGHGTRSLFGKTSASDANWYPDLGTSHD